MNATRIKSDAGYVIRHIKNGLVERDFGCWCVEVFRFCYSYDFGSFIFFRAPIVNRTLVYQRFAEVSSKEIACHTLQLQTDIMSVKCLISNYSSSFRSGLCNVLVKPAVLAKEEFGYFISLGMEHIIIITMKITSI